MGEENGEGCRREWVAAFDVWWLLQGEAWGA